MRLLLVKMMADFGVVRSESTQDQELMLVDDPLDWAVIDWIEENWKRLTTGPEMKDSRSLKMNIKQRADELAAQTMNRLDTFLIPSAPARMIQRVVAEEFEKELLREEQFRKKVDTLLTSLRKDYTEMGFPLQAKKLAHFLEDEGG